MKKFILIILMIGLGYISSYYTVGQFKGHKLFSFDTGFSLKELFRDRTPEKIAKYTAEGLEFFNKGDYYSAVDKFNEVLELDYNNITGNFYMARAKQELKEFYVAVTYYDLVINSNPDFDSAYFYRGFCNQQQGYYQKSNDDLYTFTQKHDSDYISFYYMALNFEYLDNLELAIQSCDKAISINPNYKDALFDRGRYYINAGKPELAIPDYIRVINMDSSSYVGYMNLGLAYQGVNKPDSAFIFYDKSIAINPNYAMVYTNRGYLYGEKRNYEKSIEDYTKAISIDSTYYLPYLNRASMYYTLEKYNLAINDYKKIHELQPTNIDAYYYEALCYDLLKDYENAKIIYDYFLQNASADNQFTEKVKTRLSEI